MFVAHGHLAKSSKSRELDYDVQDIDFIVLAKRALRQMLILI
jgi:hypothetical protein